MNRQEESKFKQDHFLKILLFQQQQKLTFLEYDYKAIYKNCSSFYENKLAILKNLTLHWQ